MSLPKKRDRGRPGPDRRACMWRARREFYTTRNHLKAMAAAQAQLQARPGCSNQCRTITRVKAWSHLWRCPHADGKPIPYIHLLCEGLKSTVRHHYILFDGVRTIFRDRPIFTVEGFPQSRAQFYRSMMQLLQLHLQLYRTLPRSIALAVHCTHLCTVVLQLYVWSCGLCIPRSSLSGISCTVRCTRFTARSCRSVSELPAGRQNMNIFRCI